MKYAMFGLPFFFVFLGFILLIISMFLKNKVDNMKLRCSKKVMAKITKREMSKMDDSTLCHYWYGYSIDGKEYNTRAKYMISALKYKVGDEVEICYNPNDFTDIYNPNDMGKHSHKLVFGLGIGFLLIGIVSTVIFLNNDILKSENNVSTNENNNIIDNTNNNEKKEEQNKQQTNPQIIELSKENESFDFDKLHLDFYGIKTNDGEYYYKYTLKTTYDNKEIASDFFNDKDNYRIWSRNMAADFRVFKIDEVYIFVSFIAKQCFFDEIMIFNTNGDVLKTFTTADIDIKDHSIRVKTSDNGQCMGPDLEEHDKTYNFEINGLQLIEK